MARDRHAALRDGDRRRRHRRRADGPAPGRRDAVRRLHLVRLGSPRDGGGEAVLPRADARADRRPAAVGRRVLRRAVPLAEPGELLRAHPRAEDRLPGDAARREGPPRDVDRGSEPRPLLRAQAPLPPDQGRRAGRPLHRAVRSGARPPRGRRRDDRDVGRDGPHRDRGGRGAREGGLRGRGARPADAHPVGQGARPRGRGALLEGARPARGHANGRLRRRDRGDDRRGGVRASRRAGRCASRRRTCRCRLRRRSRRHSSRRSRTSPTR